MNGAKYAYLLLDEDVKRWYKNLVRGFKITADVFPHPFFSILSNLLKKSRKNKSNRFIAH